MTNKDKFKRIRKYTYDGDKIICPYCDKVINTSSMMNVEDCKHTMMGEKFYPWGTIHQINSIINSYKKHKNLNDLIKLFDDLKIKKWITINESMDWDYFFIDESELKENFVIIEDRDQKCYEDEDFYVDEEKTIPMDSDYFLRPQIENDYTFVNDLEDLQWLLDEIEILEKRLLEFDKKHHGIYNNHLKIISWNCKMKFREDYKIIFPMNPDIVVIPECENIDRIDLGSFSDKVTDSYWIGDNDSKGLGVFTFNGFKIKLYDDYDDQYKYILPLIISRSDESYNVIGCWTKITDNYEYIGQLQYSLKHYDSFLNNKNVIICGDLNSNQYWEKYGGEDLNHKEVVDVLSQKNIYSSYHHFFNEKQGQETQPTYYHYHKKEKPFHIDFCFLSNKLIQKLKNVEIGKHEDWMELSDHVPMIIDF